MSELHPNYLSVSGVTSAGLIELWMQIAQRASAMLPRLDRLTLNNRQRMLCDAAKQALDLVSTTTDILLIAEHLRQAMRELDLITGAADTEAMLDALFSRFCLGK